MEITPKELFELSRKVEQIRKEIQQTNEQLIRLLEKATSYQSKLSNTKGNIKIYQSRKNST